MCINQQSKVKASEAQGGKRLLQGFSKLHQKPSLVPVLMNMDCKQCAC